MADCAPRLQLTVEDVVGGKGESTGVVLHFNKLDDFSPDQVARQVQGLRELLDEREMLADVLNKMESNVRFGDTLQEIFNDKSKREKLTGEVDDLIGRSSPETED